MAQNSDLFVNYHGKSCYNGYRRAAGPMEEPDSSPRGACVEPGFTPGPAGVVY